MSKTYLPYEPDQQLLLPAALQEWLPDDHLAYFISDVVDQLDISGVTAALFLSDSSCFPCSAHCLLWIWSSVPDLYDLK